ncbi:eukaryotic translation initiation factor eIF2A-domain-containing protein [Kalaharituber pfeilii]|nr:eukaryotic translation initiation factor eIF2A-domain-containing protein [Kalaharituber pfeilii]
MILEGFLGIAGGTVFELLANDHRGGTDRTQKTVGVVNAAPLYQSLPGFERPQGSLRCCCYSPDGRWFAWAVQEDVKIAEAETGAIKTTLPAAGVHEISFSPKGNYVMTWERPTKQEDGHAAPNMKVWKTESAELVASFVQKSLDGWNLQYTYDEKYCARSVTNTIEFYESDEMHTVVWNNLRVEGVTQFALSPGQNYSIAVFVAERKGAPAIVRTYTLPDFSNHTSSKSFYKADKVQLKWNELGTTVLVLAQTEVDKTGKSYYGETNLYLMSAAGNFDCRVPLDKEGPIHDVTWSPNSTEFGVVYGYMPAKTTIFDKRANVIHSLPLGPRNTILFSPHARFVLVAGFGNLQGQMDVYDRERNFTKITTIEASNASVCEWSPDGQHILTATTSPRLRVDNGVKIWHYSGPLMYLEELNELYNVYWRPQNASLFPVGSTLPPAPTPHPSAAAHIATQAPAKPAGAYRPPHARGSVTPLHFKREDEGGAAHVYTNGTSTTNNASNGLNGLGKGRRREVPGAAPADKPAPGAAPGGGVSLAGAGGDENAGLSKAALKNKKKREAAKKAKEAAAAAAAQQNGQPVPTGPAAERQGREGNKPHRGDRSRSRSNRPNNRPDGQQQGQGQGGNNRRSRSRNQEHHRGPAGDNRQQRQQNHKGQNGANTGANNPVASAPGVPTGVSGPLSPVPGTPGTPSTSEEKKVRGLHKKLRAIEELKMRLAKGERLEDTQLKKIQTEGAVRRELEMLGGV